MNENRKLSVMVYGIKVKLKRGEDLESILESYTKLNDEEKEYLRRQFL